MSSGIGAAQRKINFSGIVERLGTELRGGEVPWLLLGVGCFFLLLFFQAITTGRMSSLRGKNAKLAELIEIELKILENKLLKREIEDLTKGQEFEEEGENFEPLPPLEELPAEEETHPIIQSTHFKRKKRGKKRR